jgi:hypothetical protein
VLGAVGSGLSCRRAAERFRVSASSAIRWRAQELEVQSMTTHVKAAFLGADLGDIDMEVADRISLAFATVGPVAFHLRQSTDAMPLETVVERGARQVWDGGLQRVEAVVER